MYGEIGKIICEWSYYTFLFNAVINKWAPAWENQRFAYAKTKTQISFAVTWSAPLFSLFGQYNTSSSSIQNFKPLAISSGCTAWFVSDLVRTQIVGFLELGLKYYFFQSLALLIIRFAESEYKTVVCVPLRTFLAHLSRRLIGELKVYPCSVVRCPSVVRPSSVGVHNFKRLLLWNRLADQSQILCGASLGRGNESLFAEPGSHDQDGRHAYIWVKTLQKSSSPKPADRFQRNLVCSIWDSCPS